MSIEQPFFRVNSEDITLIDFAKHFGYLHFILMSDHFLFRTDGNQQIGLGHLFRCLALADAIQKGGGIPILVLKHRSTQVEDLLHLWKIPHFFLSERYLLNEEAQILHAYLKDSYGEIALKAVILDISHQYFHSQKYQLAEYTRQIRALTPCLALIDGLKDHALAGLPGLDLDLIISPYVGSRREDLTTFSPDQMLFGPEYFIFQKEYCELSNGPRQIADLANRILLTFGGSDPQKITLKALRALSHLNNQRLEIRVVVGPAFSRELTSAVLAESAHSQHAIRIVQSPASLAPHMMWCDIAISSTGLTKYELATLGTPSIQLSIDSAHAEMSKEFMSRGTAIHLGVHSQVSEYQVAIALKSLIGSPKLRQEMSTYGKLLLDGKGASRIVLKLREYSYGRK